VIFPAALAKVGEPLVGRHEPALLILNARPQAFVGHSLPALPFSHRQEAVITGDLMHDPV
jgi:hypothetical protein